MPRLDFQTRFFPRIASPGHFCPFYRQQLPGALLQPYIRCFWGSDRCV